ncbi:amidase [Streptomyces sp. NL15-2K]|uniref:amidase n=1 Tax=Streptomyces sp. NL15-2K TaxID=376149 RepID=UPI000F58F122|nr:MULTISPECIES: amidase [Actinomycetes]WKX12284.1 amidase [Kutzneria buriramensis]GCB46216.1 amidase [Streptomyces sp. NL15-2K]
MNADLLAAFWAYEQALAANDVPGLDHWFLDAPDTLRADGDAVLVGHSAIADFRRGRGGAPARVVERVHVVRPATGVAVVTAETRRQDGARGLQTQVWQHTDAGWRIAAAHVSAASAPTPDDRPDPAVWRVGGSRGDPLSASTGQGPLAHVRTAVKDLYAVAGQRVGAGNPAWLAEARTEEAHAAAVRRLLDAGAELTGIAQTDELAFSLAGTNAHYGTPVNPAAPGRVTGGSSSGPAAAVAHDWADLGLATDTAGSIRVPASYCGLYGWRPTHGATPTGGLLALAPSFDTAGLLARDPVLLRTAAEVLLPADEAPVPVTRLMVDEELVSLAGPEVRASFEAACRALTLRTGLPLARTPTGAAEHLEEWFAAFRAVQATEAWEQHGAWITRHPGALAPDVAARFENGRRVSAAERAEAEQILADARKALDVVLVPGTALLLPATSGPATLADAPPEEVEAVRAATLRLTCLASLAGLPAVVAPLLRVRSLPVGLCALGARGTDRALLDFTASTGFTTESRSPTHA